MFFFVLAAHFTVRARFSPFRLRLHLSRKKRLKLTGLQSGLHLSAVKTFCSPRMRLRAVFCFVRITKVNFALY